MPLSLSPSSRSSLQAKLSVVVWQDPRRSHVEAKILQGGIFFYFLGELNGQRCAVSFSVDRNLTGRLIVSRDVHVGRRQIFGKMMKDLDRIKPGVDRRGQRFPVRFSFANKLRWRSVTGDESIQARESETGVA